jgi:diamine N-acetyltransferase
MTNNILHGQHVFLRALEPEDLQMLYTWENDTEIWNVSETLSPISRFILKRYLENAHKDIFATRQLRLVVELTGTDKAIGTIDLFDFDQFHKRAGVGILIAEKDERRKGYAEEALQIMVRYCREMLKIHQLYCTISSGNQSSIDLFRKVGFVVTCTRKEWIWNGTGYLDEHFLQLIL